MKRKKKRPRRKEVVVDVAKLDNIVDKARQEPLNQEECDHLKTCIHAMAARFTPRPRTTEKASTLLSDECGAEDAKSADCGDGSGKGTAPEVAAQATAGAEEKKKRRPGSGRNGAADYVGATINDVPHPGLTPKCTCPGCLKGKLYELDPSPRVRVVAMPPIQATVTRLQQLRCNLCGEVFTAPEPEGIGEDKYDTSVAAMVAYLKYGLGMPFYRIAKLQKQMGVPLPMGTQCDLVDEAAANLQPVHDELTHMAAQGEALIYDDTWARILDEVERPKEQDENRTGLKTTGIISQVEGHKIALYITGPQHAGENTSDLLKHRQGGLPPVVGMSDALACNQLKIPPGADIVLVEANCLTHGRRHFVEVFESFPKQCQYVIEQLGLVYLHDREAREQGLSREERLSLHQQKSGPVMDGLKNWMETQFSNKLTEPNSGLGKAINYFLKRWERLTLFLRHPGAPLDSTVVERALKTSILHRKNALFFKTEHGAHMGDLFMSLIRTCEENGVNPFDYLNQLLRHVAELILLQRKCILFFPVQAWPAPTR